MTQSQISNNEGGETDKCSDMLAHLPHEVAIYILSLLTLEDVLCASLVSRHWNRLTTNPALWHRLFFKRRGWRIRPDYITSLLNNTALNAARIPIIDWKALYVGRHELDRRWFALKTKVRSNTLAVPFSPKLARCKGHTNSVYCCAVCPPAPAWPHGYIITGSRDWSIRIWDAASRECLATLQQHQGSVLCMTYSNGMLVSGSSDGTACVWINETLAGRPCPAGTDQANSPLFHARYQLSGHRAGILDICFDKCWIVTASRDGTLCVWHRYSGELVRVFREHGACVNACSINDGRVASAASNGTVYIWDPASGYVLQRLNGIRCGIATIQLSGAICLTGSSDKCIRIWDVTSGACICMFWAHEQLVRTLCYDEDRQLLLSGGWDRKTRLWDLSRTLALESHPTPVLLLEIGVHHTRVFHVQLDVTRILSACEDHSLWIADFGGQGIITDMYT